MKYTGCLLLATLLFLSGCYNSQEINLVGTWQKTNNAKGSLEFRSDYTGRAYWPDNSANRIVPR